MRKAIFDASFFLSYLLPDEKISKPVIKEFIEKKLVLVEPFIFNLEVVNGLRYALAARRLPKDKLIAIIKSFQKLENIEYVYDFDLKKLAKISLEDDVSIYDACYLYLYKETGLKFYSLDKKLAKLSSERD